MPDIRQQGKSPYKSYIWGWWGTTWVYNSFTIDWGCHHFILISTCNPSIIILFLWSIDTSIVVDHHAIRNQNIRTHAHTYTHTHTHSSYMTLIRVHEMHGRVHPNYCRVIDLLVHDTLSNGVRYYRLQYIITNRSGVQWVWILDTNLYYNSSPKGTVWYSTGGGP